MISWPSVMNLWVVARADIYNEEFTARKMYIFCHSACFSAFLLRSMK